MAGKFYAVVVGRKPGIYRDWSETKKQVEAFPGALYKGFTDLAAAENWLNNPSRCLGRRQESTPVPKTVPETEAAAAEGIHIYTDGSCLGNPGAGGYGVIIREHGQERQFSGGFRYTTNNRMEIMAAIAGLQATMAGGNPIHLYSDSSYLVNAIEKGWAQNWARRGWRKADRQPAQNRDLWEKMLALLTEKKVVFHWLRGHAGHHYNQRCDRLAVLAAKSADLPEDTGYRHPGEQP